MSADARVARAIVEVRDALAEHGAKPAVLAAVTDLIEEAMDGLHLTDDDIEGYR